MYDLTNFNQTDLCQCAIALRNMDFGAQSMEELANRMVRYLYDKLLDQQTGNSACAIVRFFKTHPYQALTIELQKAASDMLGDRSALPTTKCLTLLATVGDQPEWNSRQTSVGHKAIPLIDQDFVERAPMISQLIRQFGLEVNTVLEAAPEIMVDLERTTFNVFYIPEALGSQYIPAQKEFVIPHQIRSVLGFGGMLPSGNLFAIILFSKVFIPPDTADRFKWISAYVRIAATSLDGKTLFANQDDVK
jgi:hypothetical protein